MKILVIFLSQSQEGASPSPCTQCVNSCCKYHSCLNGGTCRENCEPTGKRFLCDCYAGYTGRLCQTAGKRYIHFEEVCCGRHMYMIK